MPFTGDFFMRSCVITEMRARMSRRSTIMSIWPFCRRNSARWKPSGSFSRTVCSITRGPAKPIRAFGSAMTTSPMKANDADTPPIVGSVRTEMKGRPASERRVTAAVVFAICMSDRRPSCMRAPPEAAKHTKGQLRRIASSTPREKRSPTTEPMEPPMYLNSKAAATIGSRRSVPDITTIASVSPVVFSAASRRLG